MKEQQIPLFALETQDPIKDFDFLCMTLQYELCYPNILQILDLGGIPLKSADRTDHMPIVIGGGPCAYNPEPIADFFDIFYIGEGETVYDDLFDLYEQMKEDGSYSRQNFLHEAAKIPGLYVPSLYEVSYKADGTIAGFQPVYEDIPTVIHRQVVEICPNLCIRTNRWYHLLKSHRIASFWKSSEAVSVAVVFVRPVWCTVHCGNAVLKC